MGVFFQSISMGASVLPVAIFTAIWGVVGVLLPVLVPRSPHKSVIQVLIPKLDLFSLYCNVNKVCLIITASCCWLFWLCCYMSQVFSLNVNFSSANEPIFWLLFLSILSYFLFDVNDMRPSFFSDEPSDWPHT